MNRIKKIIKTILEIQNEVGKMENEIEQVKKDMNKKMNKVINLMSEKYTDTSVHERKHLDCNRAGTDYPYGDGVTEPYDMKNDR